VGGTVLLTDPRGADRLRTPTTDYRPTVADLGRSDEAVPAPAVRPYRVSTADSDSEGRAGRSIEENGGSKLQRGTATGTGRYDPGCTAIWIGSPRFED
jgi:hypothetical protein